MRGHADLVQARLNRWPVGGVDIIADGLPGFDRRGKSVWFYLVPGGDEGTADLRGCHGLPVFIHASYAQGWAIFDRLVDFEPLSIALCAPDCVVTFDGERVEEWAV